MFVVCDETAEQAKRTRAKKEGKVKEQIEQLKSDIETLKAALRLIAHQDMRTDDFLISRIKMFETKLAELEKQADDPWKGVKMALDCWSGSNSNVSSPYRDVVRYVRHLEEKAKQLESTAIPAEVFNRAALQRRIKHQRRELRMLNRGMHRQALEIKSYEHTNSDLHRNKGYLMGEIVKHQEKIRGLESEIKGMKAMKS
jgi:DNA repair exonuclease SbcCD ATPase subunit